MAASVVVVAAASAFSASAFSRNAPSTTTVSPAREARQDLDLAAEVAPAPDLPDLEAPASLAA